MANYLVECHTPDNADFDRRIQGLGGVWGWHPIDTIIYMIDRGDFFWTYVQSKPTAVIVKTHPSSGRRYLTTIGDEFPPNNLLNLPHCPGR